MTTLPRAASGIPSFVGGHASTFWQAIAAWMVSDTPSKVDSKGREESEPLLWDAKLEWVQTWSMQFPAKQGIFPWACVSCLA